MSTEKYYLPDDSTGFFKSSSGKRLFSSIRPESKSIGTFGELFTTFFFSAKDEPIFYEGFLALIYM
jgi:hypothetical protein